MIDRKNGLVSGEDINGFVNVFFASDDKYLPYLEVALVSLCQRCDRDKRYLIHVLSSGLSRTGLREVKRTLADNVRVVVDDVCEYVEPIKEALGVRLRDYYSDSIYFRLFIASLYPTLSRAVYLDSDIVLLDDVAALHDTSLDGCILGAVCDESVISTPVFCDYVKGYVGMADEREYFNSGVLVMDLDAFRQSRILDKFLHLLEKHNFPTVAPDQDYLNLLCYGKVKYLPLGWNKHAIEGRDIDERELHLVHYNMFNKPWHYTGVPYEDIFWRYAEATPAYDELSLARAGYTDNDRQADAEAGARLLSSAQEILKTAEPLYKTARASLCEGGF